MCLINSNLVYNMTNKIGLTFLLAWFAVMAIVANYSYDRNVPYRGNTGDEYASKMCRLDIAYQPDVQNAPVVVWFHGGGLTGGSREIRQSPLPEIHAPERIQFRTRRGGFRKLARPCRSQTAREWPIPGLGKKPRSSY